MKIVAWVPRLSKMVLAHKGRLWWRASLLVWFWNQTPKQGTTFTLVALLDRYPFKTRQIVEVRSDLLHLSPLPSNWLNSTDVLCLWLMDWSLLPPHEHRTVGIINKHYIIRYGAGYKVRHAGTGPLSVSRTCYVGESGSPTLLYNMHIILLSLFLGGSYLTTAS